MLIFVYLYNIVLLCSPYCQNVLIIISIIIIIIIIIIYKFIKCHVSKQNYSIPEALTTR